MATAEEKEKKSTDFAPHVAPMRPMRICRPIGRLQPAGGTS